MTENEKSPTNVPFWITRIRDIVLVIVAIATAITGYFTSVTNSKLDKQGKVLDQTIKKKEFDNSVRFRIFEEVMKVVNYDSAKKDSLKNDRLIKVVALLVTEVLADDSSFRKKMMEVISKSPYTPDTIKNQFNSELFELAQSQLQSQISEEKAKDYFRIDVFYLEDLPEAKSVASLIRELLLKEYPSYDVRLRLMPASKNKVPGYKIDRNEIRYEENEKSLAKEIGSKIGSSGIIKHDINTKLVKNYTPNYLSVFIKSK